MKRLMTSCVVRWMHGILFTLAPILAAGACDCCERGPCPAHCGAQQAPCPSHASCCCAKIAAKSTTLPCCAASAPALPPGICVDDGCTGTQPCRCWAEPKETVAGQDDRHSVHPDSFGHGFAGASTPSHDDVREHQSGGILTKHERVSSLIPSRPVRVLYGVWRN